MALLSALTTKYPCSSSWTCFSLLLEIDWFEWFPSHQSGNLIPVKLSISLNPILALDFFFVEPIPESITTWDFDLSFWVLLPKLEDKDFQSSLFGKSEILRLGKGTLWSESCKCWEKEVEVEVEIGKDMEPYPRSLCCSGSCRESVVREEKRIELAMKKEGEERAREASHLISCVWLSIHKVDQLTLAKWRWVNPMAEGEGGGCEWWWDESEWESSSTERFEKWLAIAKECLKSGILPNLGRTK